MTRDELDALWSRAMHEAIKAGEDFTRYHFAALLREKMVSEGWRQCAQGQKTSQFCAVAEQARTEEREACAKVCDAADKATHPADLADAIRARGQPDPKVTHLNEWARDRLARHGIQIPEDDDGPLAF